VAVEVKKLVSHRQTGARMAQIVRRFAGDLRLFQFQGKPLPQLPLHKFFDIVKDIPYKQDKRGIEIISRPLNILTSPVGGADCKKKAILVASWLKLNGYPWRFVATSMRADGKVHHVIVQGRIDGAWRDIDATYNTNQLYTSPGPTERRDILPDWYQADAASMSGPLLVELHGRGRNHIEAINSGRAAILQVNGPQQMGSITGLIAAGVGLVGAVIGGVAAKKRQERQHKHEIRMFEAQETIDPNTSASWRDAIGDTQFTKNILIPGAALVAALAFL